MNSIIGLGADFALRKFASPLRYMFRAAPRLSAGTRRPMAPNSSTSIACIRRMASMYWSRTASRSASSTAVARFTRPGRRSMTMAGGSSIIPWTAGTGTPCLQQDAVDVGLLLEGDHLPEVAAPLAAHVVAMHGAVAVTRRRTRPRASAPVARRRRRCRRARAPARPVPSRRRPRVDLGLGDLWERRLGVEQADEPARRGTQVEGVAHDARRAASASWLMSATKAANPAASMPKVRIELQRMVSSQYCLGPAVLRVAAPRRGCRRPPRSSRCLAEVGVARRRRRGSARRRPDRAVTARSNAERHTLRYWGSAGRSRPAGSRAR